MAPSGRLGEVALALSDFAQLAREGCLSDVLHTRQAYVRLPPDACILTERLADASSLGLVVGYRPDSSRRADERRPGRQHIPAVSGGWPHPCQASGHVRAADGAASGICYRS